jgi:hypothetical protein
LAASFSSRAPWGALAHKTSQVLELPGPDFARAGPTSPGPARLRPGRPDFARAGPTSPRPARLRPGRSDLARAGPTAPRPASSSALYSRPRALRLPHRLRRSVGGSGGASAALGGGGGRLHRLRRSCDMPECSRHTRRAGTRRAGTQDVLAHKTCWPTACWHTACWHTRRAGTRRAGPRRAGTRRAGTRRAGTRRAGTRRAGTRRAGTRRARRCWAWRVTARRCWARRARTAAALSLPPGAPAPGPESGREPRGSGPGLPEQATQEPEPVSRATRPGPRCCRCGVRQRRQRICICADQAVGVSVSGTCSYHASPPRQPRTGRGTSRPRHKPHEASAASQAVTGPPPRSANASSSHIYIYI